MQRFGLSRLSGASVIALCAVVLLGWQFDVPFLRSILPRAPQTTPLTAVMLAALGLALLVSDGVVVQKWPARWAWLSWALVTLVLLVACVEAYAYLAFRNPGLDTLMFPRRVLPLGGKFPGRPSPQTLISALLIGASIGLSPVLSSWARRWSRILVVPGFVVPWLALFGYASLTSPFYALLTNPSTGISPLTAIGFVGLCLGVLGLHPGQGLLGLLAASTSGGQLFRVLLPVTIAIPLLLGWLLIYARESGVVDSATGLAFSWGFFSLLMAGLLTWQALALHRRDLDREELLKEIGRANAQLKRHADALERSNTELQQFAYVASHDLQTPLRSIAGFMQLFQSGYGETLDETARDWIRRAVDSAGHMQTLINDILTYSRVDSRARPFERVRLNDVSDQVLALLEESIRDSGAEVTRGDLPIVNGDRYQLVSLLQNLVGNALKYQSNRQPKIQISAESRNGNWLVSVQDNGIGIAPDQHERVFQIFGRLHAQHEYPGTGIGLAICRRVVERHGGKIWVDSEPGEGSTFFFILPD